MQLSIAAYVILGMLGLREGSGYDIKQRVDRSTRYFSTISDAQIYPLLKQLERAGLISGRAEPRGRRPRRVYELTPDGEAALREWLQTPEPLLLDIWDTGMLKLFFADALQPAEALQLVRAIRARSERILDDIQHRSEPAARLAQQRGHRFPPLLIPFGIAMHKAWIDCCRKIERELSPRRDDLEQAGRPRARRSG